MWRWMCRLCWWQLCIVWALGINPPEGAWQDLMLTRIYIATRGSRLAQWQAHFVRARLMATHPDLDVLIKIVKTKGDILVDAPLAQFGGKGLFVKEIEEALLDGRADIAVHSMKDIPIELPQGLILGAIPERENPLDVFLSAKYSDLESLPPESKIGTSSLRRQAQLLALRHDLHVIALRGNVDTRLRRMINGDFDAIIMAAAGMKRLDLGTPYEYTLKPDIFLPAVGQGALGIECREHDEQILSLLACLDHQATRLCIEAERGLLIGLNGGCQAPIAGYAILDQDTIFLQGMIAAIDGSKVLRQSMAGSAHNASQIGLELAENLLQSGGFTLLNI